MLITLNVKLTLRADPLPPSSLTSILFVLLNTVLYTTACDLTSVFSDCLLQLPFEQSNSPSKCIDTVHVKHGNDYHYIPSVDAHTICISITRLILTFYRCDHRVYYKIEHLHLYCISCLN